MSIITELMDCIRTANRSYEDARNPYNDREILHIPEEELTAIAKRIRKANNEAINKAHADGERNALKQNRSRSEDYRRGYAAGYAKGQEDGMDNIDGGTEVECIRSSITDELRRYAANWDGWFYDDKDGGLINAIGHDPIQSTPVPNIINGIADRIDAEHAKAVEQAHADGLNEQIDYLERFVPSNYVLLPVDADGVPIHVGDVMEWPTTGETFEVVGIGDGTLFYIEDGSECADWTGATTKRHHQPDSWERIIQDATAYRTYDKAPCSISELVERCRKLAGDAE